jgi:hypothetical protein
MRLSDIEAWCLSVVDRVRSHRRIEDARVEVKAEWPPAEKAARRIAGHANAARGEPIRWVVGLDEGAGTVTGAQGDDTAPWFAGVTALFDGLAPRLIDLVVPTEDGDVVALYFETDRGPLRRPEPRRGQVGLWAGRA